MISVKLVTQTIAILYRWLYTMIDFSFFPISYIFRKKRHFAPSSFIVVQVGRAVRVPRSEIERIVGTIDTCFGQEFLATLFACFGVQKELLKCA